MEGPAVSLGRSYKLIGVTDRFEYVTFNGERVSRADAEDKMKNEGTFG